MKKFNYRAKDKEDKIKSDNIGGPSNTIQQGVPVPLCYGRMIIGSAMISAGISVEEQVV